MPLEISLFKPRFYFSAPSIKKYFSSMALYTCNPSTQDDHEFEVRLGYMLQNNSGRWVGGGGSNREYIGQ
jgi:hypothetical protein